MAYMSQERKKEIHAKIKPILRKYGMKGSMAVRTHSTLVLNLKSGKVDFAADLNRERVDIMGNMARPAEEIRKNYQMDINPFWYQEHFTGIAKAFLTEIFAEMNKGNHDRSDIQSDYFDVGWYVDVNVGNWNKPYEQVA